MWEVALRDTLDERRVIQHVNAVAAPVHVEESVPDVQLPVGYGVEYYSRSLLLIHSTRSNRAVLPSSMYAAQAAKHTCLHIDDVTVTLRLFGMRTY